MKIRLVLAIAGMAIGFTGPALAQQNAAGVDPAIIQQLENTISAKYNEAVDKHDAAAIAALYTEDAVWETYHGTFHGRQRIEGVYADWSFKRWNKHNWVTTMTRVAPAGNEVRATGSWSCDLGGGGADRGLCSWVLVHDGDTWKIRRESLTSDNFHNN